MADTNNPAKLRALIAYSCEVIDCEDSDEFERAVALNMAFEDGAELQRIEAERAARDFTTWSFDSIVSRAAQEHVINGPAFAFPFRKAASERNPFADKAIRAEIAAIRSERREDGAGEFVRWG
jgi:hypothetical protein